MSTKTEHVWTDAEADAARLALELECLLTDKDMPMPVLSRWWDSAHEALELHRERLRTELADCADELEAAAREALSVQPAEPVALIAAAVERVRNTIIVEGESPEKLREAIALRVADMGKQTFALPQPAPSVPAVPEFCCEHAWSAAKQLAWKERDLNCDCDHNEYCPKCWPLEFRAGGKWDSYAAAPRPAAKADELAKLRQWRDIADDMLTVFHEVASDDPRESIDRLINWHVQVALDPAVSSDAAALVEVGRQQGAKLRQGEPMAPNNDEVICPNCAHQFRAIPVHVQEMLLAAGYEPPFYASASTVQPPREALQPLGENDIRDALRSDLGGLALLGMLREDVKAGDFARAMVSCARAVIAEYERVNGITPAQGKGEQG